MLTACLHNERELLLGIARDDEHAFTCLFNYYKNKIYTIAYKLTESPAMAEEAVQEIFMKLWIKRKELPAVEHFNAWFCTVARNHMFTLFKRKAVNACREFSEIDTVCLFNYDTEERVLLKETETIIKKALHALPPQQNKVYHLIKEKGYKKEEAAAFLNLSPETVKIHLAKAMKNIRAYCLAHMDSPAMILIAFCFL
ncbi:sigma-70 family RNA polymerase sigma factor [Agriterribacter sp.]|uniref:RNA polymerase sigma factor n=1 Tax=Agriterribacter sp. TaxID=2821509 RepID=UPI002BD9E035|nr:sigma-70 family RNA polymerase sigma factor [Agriterribacter sp.]HRO48365.1 sigma-70 family RNA polymerase sigma factor [Agriterribacter sp.]HRQ19388.1 sigma-70 family RNA polymerase sigma factor [Agriterribacter sp.]